VLQDSDGTVTGALLNYGIVTYDDDGTPLWVCEEALDDDGVPRGAVRTDEGVLVVLGAREGLYVSRDDGCSAVRVPALADVIVADVMRDSRGRLLVATRDPRVDAIVAQLDVDTLALTMFASFSRAVVERMASDGERIAVALSPVGTGVSSLVVIDESGVREVETPHTPALPFLDETGNIVIAMPFDELAWSLTPLSDDGTLAEVPSMRAPRRPHALLEFEEARFVISDGDVFIDSARGTFTPAATLENPSCLIASAGEVLICTTGRDREILALSPRGTASSRFATARVRPRACASGTRGAEVCPAVWEFLQITQAIGRDLPRVDDDDDTSGCGACRIDVDAHAPISAITMLGVLSALRRRRLRCPTSARSP
jgi:hypothetical protein